MVSRGRIQLMVESYGDLSTFFGLGDSSRAEHLFCPWRYRDEDYHFENYHFENIPISEVVARIRETAEAMP